ncbi:putative leucine-rich repeat receptor-like protein kinase [Artemisia annua]|uniref:Putative leucine-rich repeat receptor-like protein kinase n=1 Tax=Artemisia annua TaxID=35608 RepID=A0A2U1M236_ARTAN|nr:putative leucine-rich repeat receptor-like protein kinase [Artemisia annua]
MNQEHKTLALEGSKKEHQKSVKLFWLSGIFGKTHHSTGTMGRIHVVAVGLASLAPTLVTLSSMGLSGGLPGDIGQFTEIFVRARRSIPPTIGNLKNLYWLDLSQNNLTGSLPVSNGTTPGLDIHFGDNQLDGDIPLRLFNSKMTLVHLLFQNNRLTGPIPSTLGLVKSLEVVRLDRNSLSGNVPSNFNNLTNVMELRLSYNQLNGPVPNLTGMNSLNYVDLSNNGFGQTKIPSWFTALQSLTTLKMRYTNLAGELSAALFSLLYLQNV